MSKMKVAPDELLKTKGLLAIAELFLEDIENEWVVGGAGFFIAQFAQPDQVIPP
jgi:hypothetical protein